jgi:uncharacterized coiled-coil protein SlyX
MEARLVELEIRYTHLEQQVQELSELVFRQDKTIAELRARLAALEAGSTPHGGEGEKPPHY